MTVTVIKGTSMKTFKEFNTAHPRQTTSQLRNTRNKQIVEMRQCGFTLSQIAEYFEMSRSGINHVLQQSPYYSRGVGKDDLRGRKLTCDMSVKITPEPTPINKVVASGLRKTITRFPNRLCGGN